MLVSLIIGTPFIIVNLKVAIKCLKAQEGVTEETVQRVSRCVMFITRSRYIQRLRREIGIWWCLKHENILPLLGTAYSDRFGDLPAMVSPVDQP